ncbi:PmbA/TldA family metallopeptidase, partial [Nocardia brasiliensis]|uniref:PmbA/TldA family metallopeptidase n=1 Tax=Nocardia brasiliensis TaxID=37326 RepID=UPI003D76EBD1
MIAAGEVVERVLALSRADEAMVIVTDAHDASLRWAGNSMTTNGSSNYRDWAVISIFRDGPRAARVGTIGSTSVDPAEIEAVVRRSEEGGPPPPPPPKKKTNQEYDRPARRADNPGTEIARMLYE